MSLLLTSLIRRRLPKTFVQPSVIRLIGLGSLLIAAGCSDDVGTGTTIPAKENVLWALTVSPRGITMARGETLPLSISARNILGNSMTIPDSMPVVLESNNESVVSIAANGGLTAHGVTPGISSPVRIIASWTWQGITKSDTVFVVVTENRPHAPVASISIAPPPYPDDSTWAGWPFGSRVIPVTATTAEGDTVAGVFAYVYTQQRRQGSKDVLDPMTRSLQFIVPPGKFWVYADAYAYGVTLHDSLEYTQTANVLGGINLSPDPIRSNGVISQFANATQTIAPCAMLTIQNSLAVSISVTLDSDDPWSNCTGFDDTSPVTNVPPNGIVFRRIKAPGMHTWVAVRSDGVPFADAVTGKIRVQSHTELE